MISPQRCTATVIRAADFAEIVPGVLAGEVLAKRREEGECFHVFRCFFPQAPALATLPRS
jgi:hypothetical protein